MRMLFLAASFLFAAGGSPAQSSYWVGFTDKKGSSFSVDRPQEFLSPRALERRARQSIPVDLHDLPVSRQYTDSVVQEGATLLCSSKWLNGITVRLHNDSNVARISRFPFVREVVLSKPALPAAKEAVDKFGVPWKGIPIDSSYYGLSVSQVAMLKGQLLHSRGFRGKGLVVAVLDAGFANADSVPALDSLRLGGRLLGSRDFVDPGGNLFRGHYHGMSVLSAMAGNLPGQLIGTAPDASFWLLRTEDAASEYPIEEDFWVAGAEFADSVGADLINSSLGYSVFDLPSLNHRYGEMDGRTTRVTRGANWAASRGILVFSSAGNEGNKSWRYITAPADGDSVIAVAAVDREGLRASFSSVGPSARGAVKPELAAMGSGTAVSWTDGSVYPLSGTSFSSPVLAGMTASLWQAYPSATASQVRKALIMSGDRSLNPDTLLGYGIPDMQAASLLLQGFTHAPAPEEKPPAWQVFPNPFSRVLCLFPSSSSPSPAVARLYGLSGILAAEWRLDGPGIHRIGNLEKLPFGMWLLEITAAGSREVFKLTGGNR